MAYIPIIVPRMVETTTPAKPPVTLSVAWAVVLGDERVEVLLDQQAAIDRAAILSEVTGKFYSVRLEN
jgi:hypothetical protein